jgi:hypothetical protein
MSDDEHHDFAQADSGASSTYPKQCSGKSEYSLLGSYKDAFLLNLV